MSAKAMTANLLRDGDVVYLTAADTWSLWLRDAAVVHDQSGEAGLEASAKQAEKDRVVIGPYLMDVAESAAGPRPIGTREKIRAKGPTVHLHFGKQAMDGGAQLRGAEGAE